MENFPDIVLIGDSRVTDLKTPLRNRQDISMIVNCYPGANLKTLQDTAEYMTKNHHYKHIYIFGGINDITTKTPGVGTVSIEYDCVDDIHTSLMKKYTTCLKVIKDADPTVKVIFLPLIGLDIGIYNGRPRCRRGTGAYLTPWKVNILPHPQQGLLNESIVATNETLLALNVTQNVHTPLINHGIHKRVRAHSPIKHMYEKLEDGLHPTQDTADKWAAAIAKTAISNREKFNL